MQNLASFSHLIDKLLRYRFQTILLVCFFVWTPLLIIETLQIQHSCHPMIHWSVTLPAECEPKPPIIVEPPPNKGSGGDGSEVIKGGTGKKPVDESNLVGKIIKAAKEHPDITGSVIGIGVAGTVAAVTTVPLVAAAGIGVAVWFAIRTVL